MLSPRPMGSSSGKILHETFFDDLIFFVFFHIPDHLNDFFGRQGFSGAGFYSTSGFFLIFGGLFCFPCLDLVSIFITRTFPTSGPVFLQLKQHPSFMRRPLSSSVRAARAQVHLAEVSMAFGSLAKLCCHCCLEGCQGGLFLLPLLGLPK